MALPDTIRVKLSTEAAEGITITPVVVQEMAIRDLIEFMLGVTGKDPERAHELLLRGTLVSGASRFRWTGWDADRESIQRLMATFPDPEPGRVFAPALCVRAVLRGGRQPVEISKEAGARRPLLRRESFWDVLMQVAASGDMRYRDYSYKYRADQFQVEFSVAAAQELQAAAGRLTYSTLREQVRSARFTGADFFVER